MQTCYTYSGKRVEYTRNILKIYPEMNISGQEACVSLERRAPPDQEAQGQAKRRAPLR